MAYVTDVLLCISPIEEDGSGDSIVPIEDINNWLLKHVQGQLRKVSNYSGGRARARSFVYMGAFNYLDHSNFLAFVDKCGWQLRHCVQVYLRRQNDQMFSEYRFLNGKGPTLMKYVSN